MHTGDHDTAIATSPSTILRRFLAANDDEMSDGYVRNYRDTTPSPIDSMDGGVRLHALDETDLLVASLAAADEKNHKSYILRSDADVLPGRATHEPFSAPLLGRLPRRRVVDSYGGDAIAPAAASAAEHRHPTPRERHAETEIFSQPLSQRAQLLCEQAACLDKEEVASLRRQLVNLHAMHEKQATAAATLKQNLTLANAERDQAMLRLAVAEDDIAAMGAQLQDCAAYIVNLKAKIAEQQLHLKQLRAVAIASVQAKEEAEAEADYFERGAEQAFAYAHQAAEQAAASTSDNDDPFSLSKIKESIEEALAEMKSLPESEQKKKIRQLQLRWHPDKHPVLGNLAVEVSKILNVAVDEFKAKQQAKNSEGEHGAADGANDSADTQESAPRGDDQGQPTVTTTTTASLQTAMSLT